MEIYEKILKNKEYLDCSNQIETMKFITNGKWDWEHGLNHYKRVANYVKKILTQLKCNDRTIDLGMATALLHDIGLSKCDGNKVDHAIQSSKLFRKYIINLNITKEEEYIIEQAIVDHSNGDNIESIIGMALVLADKLDITYHRTENSSIQDKINQEIQKIRDVDIEITDSNFIVKYSTINDFDINILNEWKKALTIPKKIACYLDKKYIFMINGENIDI